MDSSSAENRVAVMLSVDMIDPVLTGQELSGMVQPDLMGG